MSEEYEKWNKSPYGRSNYAAYDQENIKLGWMACEEAMQAKLDAKDKELEALKDNYAELEQAFDQLKRFYCLDRHPLPLLTGGK